MLSLDSIFFEYMVKFLVIRFSSIGDIVLTTPVLRLINNQIDNSQIHFLTKEENISLINNNPYIHKIHSLKTNNYNELINKLYNEKFDYIIDLHNNIRTLRIKRHLKIISFTFKKLNIEKWLIVNFKYNRLPNIHIVDRYIDTLNAFGIKNDNKGLDYFINNKDTYKINNLFNNKKKIISFIIGAKHFTKQIPTNLIIDICNSVDYNIILLGGEQDYNKSIEIISNTTNVINKVNELNINQSASIISQSDLIITSDTGLMHIASALKKIIISIWGNTIPEFGMTPYLPDEKSIIIQNTKIKCRPCSKIGYNQCPKKHFKCMNDLNSLEIISSIKSILK